MKPLCEKLSITVTELLNGEDLSNIKNDNVIKYIEKNEKSKKTQIATTTAISIFLIIVIILGCYFFNTYNKVAVYELYGESEHFYYNNALLIKSNIKQIFTEGEIDVKDNYINDKNIYTISLYCNNQLIYKENYEHTTSKNIVENYGDNEYFNESNLNNLKEWFIEIEYEKDNETIKEKIYLNNRIIMKNNKLLYLKNKEISQNNEKMDEIKIDEKSKVLEEEIKEKGYIQKDKDTYEKDYLEGKIEIVIREESVYISKFKYIDDSYLVVFNPYRGSYSFINKKNNNTFTYYKKDDSFYCNGEKCNIKEYKVIESLLINLEEEFMEVIS